MVEIARCQDQCHLPRGLVPCMGVNKLLELRGIFDGIWDLKISLMLIEMISKWMYLLSYDNAHAKNQREVFETFQGANLRA